MFLLPQLLVKQWHGDSSDTGTDTVTPKTDKMLARHYDFTEEELDFIILSALPLVNEEENKIIEGKE